MGQIDAFCPTPSQALRMHGLWTVFTAFARSWDAQSQYSKIPTSRVRSLGIEREEGMKYQGCNK